MKTKIKLIVNSVGFTFVLYFFAGITDIKCVFLGALCSLLSVMAGMNDHTQ